MVVLREGNNTGILQREEYNDEKILKLATVKNVGGI
jgi:hypothetical protein